MEQFDTLQSQLKEINTTLSDLRVRFGKVETTLQHNEGDDSRLVKVLDDLEFLLYGKGADTPDHVGLISRVQSLETSRKTTRNVLWAVWALMSTLVIDLVHSLWGGK